MRANLERQRRRIAGEEIVCERGLHDGAQRRQRRACGYRIGGVGGDEKGRTIAPPDRPLEAAGDLHTEQDLAGEEQVVELLDIMHLPDKAEIGGVLQRF